MTESEWLKNGYSMGVVEPDEICDLSFSDVFWSWFAMKSGKIQPQSLDRIECTYNRYFKDMPIACKLVAEINERYIIDWLTVILIRSGSVTKKEFSRIYQVVRGVMMYSYDLELKGVRLLDWNKIMRYMPTNCIVNTLREDACISRKEIDILFHAVLIDDVYPLKKSACLCLLLNFYLGLRVGELSALTWNDVDFKRRLLNVSKTEVKYFERDENMNRSAHMKYFCKDGTKTLASMRVVPLCNEALYLLQLLKQHHISCNYVDERLAYDGTQTVLSRSLDRTMKKLCQLCEIPLYNTHRIRKTCASYLHDSQIPIKTVSDLLGIQIYKLPHAFI